MSGPVKRPYDSSRRRDQARRTRARIVEAATELFVEHGYGATSITAIAGHAGVAPQTIYATFGTKAALLSEAVDVAMAGDDEPVAVMDRPEARAVLDAPTPGEAAARYARFTTRLLARAGRLLDAADGAAQQDPDLVPLWVEGHRGRLADLRRLTATLEARGFLREGVSADDATDVLWITGSPDAYRAFTVIQGWSAARYERWLATTVARDLLRPD